MEGRCRMMATWRKRGYCGGTWRVGLLKAEVAAATGIPGAAIRPPTALKRSTRGSVCRGISEQVGWTTAREMYTTRDGGGRVTTAPACPAGSTVGNQLRPGPTVCLAPISSPSTFLSSLPLGSLKHDSHHGDSRGGLRREPHWPTRSQLCWRALARGARAVEAARLARRPSSELSERGQT
jgi:hypothetical protein